MKTTFLVLLAAVLAAAPARAADDPKGTPARAGDEDAIRATIEGFAQAFRKGDAKALAALFVEDGEAVGEDGVEIQGRAAIERHYASRLGAGPGETIETAVESIKFLAPGVARATGRTRVTPSAGGPTASGRFSTIHVKGPGGWLVASVEELPDAEAGHQDRLKELEWLVGDWVEESDEAVVLNSVAWADNKHFLIRTFDVKVKGKPALSGTQRIGWDPLTRQIKSWIFDSTGGYGDALWMRSGNQWVIKATGVRPDGRTATATQVLTFVDKDSLRWKSIDRTHGDEVAEDIAEVVLVRKPPPPR